MSSTAASSVALMNNRFWLWLLPIACLSLVPHTAIAQAIKISQRGGRQFDFPATSSNRIANFRVVPIWMPARK